LPSNLWKRTLFAIGCLVAALLIAFFVVRPFLLSKPQGRQASINLSVDQDVDDFFNAYWRRPIPIQGTAPASFTEREASLRPEACASCHPQQYADWKGSLHGKAMGPGPWGQIIDLSWNSPHEAVLCMSCHAPLSEQMPFLAEDNGAAAKKHAKNPSYDPQLQLEGITCAACHVRQHRRFGPPKAERVSAGYPPGIGNHGGAVRTPHFEKAEFCKECHQFDPKETVLVNGKPLQDTFREWQDSAWGKGEASCQQCHMPNRRHLWKGIHDAEWVRGGVRFEAELGGRSPLEITLKVTNAAVGHKFPTYITPKVFVRGALLDQSGKMIPGSEQERVIGWDARFEDGGWKEYFDTRVAPGKRFQARFRWPLPGQAKKIRAWVEIHPDHFYHHHFYPAYLKDRALSPEGRKLIEKALLDSGRTPYILFEELIPLN